MRQRSARQRIRPSAVPSRPATAIAKQPSRPLIFTPSGRPSTSTIPTSCSAHKSTTRNKKYEAGPRNILCAARSQCSIFGFESMSTRRELQQLACLRLREAEALFNSGCHDGSAYLCGYVVELALKAAICATLGVADYPDDRLKGAFKTHDFEQLKLLAGMEQAFTATTGVLTNW